MKFKDLEKKEEKELQKMLADFRAKLLELRFRDASRQLKNVREIRKVRKKIAWVLTALNQKKQININNKTNQGNK
jgi:large subunit ribosomal protein L29